MKNSRNEALAADLLDRFTRYVKIYTTSDRSSTTKPSTARQWDLLHLLEAELVGLGLKVQTDPLGYVLATLAASPGRETAPVIAFLAHVDAAPDAPGEHVKPLVHQNYNGKALTLPGGAVLDPAENPLLLNYVGKTLITSDGTTLLSADDKAGVAEIMAAVAFLKAHPELPHPAVEVIFTSDEEIGRGVEGFPFAKVASKQAYTMDGGEEGTFEAECVNAHGAKVTFTGRSYHPGAARGKMVNAVSMVTAFLNLFPRNESPEATDGRFGYMWANDIQAGIESATVEVYMRDFDLAQNERRLESLHAYAKAVEAAFPGGKVDVKTSVQYLNMKAKLDQSPRVVDLLVKAIRATGIEPRLEAIRGGTDGSRLTEQGLPTPNIFTGGMNYHSRTEWVALDAMVRASNVIIELAGLWAQEPAGPA